LQIRACFYLVILSVAILVNQPDKIMGAAPISPFTEKASISVKFLQITRGSCLEARSE
jgi:hypothetical protein